MSKTKQQERRERKHRNSKIANAIDRLDKLNPALDKLQLRSGDILIVLGTPQEMDRAMLQGFMQVLHSRGLVVDILVMDPRNNLEVCTAEQFEKVAHMRGYCKQEVSDGGLENRDGTGSVQPGGDEGKPGSTVGARQNEASESSQEAEERTPAQEGIRSEEIPAESTQVQQPGA